MSERATTPAEILEARARKLAQRIDRERVSTTAVEMLGFTVGRERYAIESRFVFAVAQLANLVPLPGAQAPVVGVTRWRGDVLTVLDLRRVVGGAPSALDDLGRVIVVGEATAEFGVLADILDSLLSIDPAALHPLSSTRQVEIPGLLRGVTADAVHVIDAATLIAHQTASASIPTIIVPSSSPGAP
jgi:purine-binding chemotaxis protein CheW